MGVLDNYRRGVAYPDSERPAAVRGFIFRGLTATEVFGVRNISATPVSVRLVIGGGNETNNQLGVLDINIVLVDSGDPLDGTPVPATSIVELVPGPLTVEVHSDMVTVPPLNEAFREYIPANGGSRLDQDLRSVDLPVGSIGYLQCVPDVDVSEYTVDLIISAVGNRT